MVDTPPVIPTGAGATAGTSPLSGLMGSAPAGASSNSSQEDVTLLVGNQQISGWSSVRITRGIERMPADFDIKLTEKYPGATANVIVQPGMPCIVKIGPNQVISGYIDKYVPEINENNHTIRITGRSKCQDLVDCSALWPGGQIVSTTALDIATKLAAPYGIKVSTLPSQKNLFPLPEVPFQLLMYTETPADIIARSCGNSGLLFYDDVNGDLVLAQVGTTKAACGFQEGVNVQSASGTFTMDQRFTYMAVRLQAMAYMADAGNQGSAIYPPGGEPVVTLAKDGTVKVAYPPNGIADPGVPRFRNKNIISEYSNSLINGKQYIQAKWEWEKNRRFGRAFRVDLTTDSWRDSAGNLWTPNTLADISIPSIRMLQKVTYVISEVTYQRDEENGTTCRIVAMPPEAFTVQPIIMQPVAPDAAGKPIQIPAQTSTGTPTKSASVPTTNTTATSPIDQAFDALAQQQSTVPISDSDNVNVFTQITGK